MDSIGKDLEALYEQWGDQFYHCALAVTGQGPAAEDAVHNAFRKVLQLTRKPTNLKAYVFRSVRNAAIDLIRKDGRNVELTADMLFDLPAEDVANPLEHREFLTAFSKALECLSADERETITLHLVSHLSFQEIADVRERPMGTVTSWYRRGLKKLKHQLTPAYGSL